MKYYFLVVCALFLAACESQEATTRVERLEIGLEENNKAVKQLQDSLSKQVEELVAVKKLLPNTKPHSTGIGIRIIKIQAQTQTVEDKWGTDTDTKDMWSTVPSGGERDRIAETDEYQETEPGLIEYWFLEYKKRR